MIRWIRDWLDRRRTKRACANIREAALMCGFDLSHMTDEEIAAGVLDASRVLAQTGITTEQAAESLAVLGRVDFLQWAGQGAQGNPATIKISQGILDAVNRIEQLTLEERGWGDAAERFAAAGRKWLEREKAADE